MTIDRISCEHATLWSLLVNGRIEEILDTGITPEWFGDKTRYLYEWIQSFLADHGKLPDSETYHQAYRQKRPEVLEPFSYYAAELRLWNQNSIINQAMQEMANLLASDDVTEATAVAASLGERMQIDYGAMADMVLDGNLYEVYDRRRREGERKGLTTGFNVIDETVGGMHPGQLITLVGPPKAGKTFTLCGVASRIWQSEHDVLFVTFEMGRTQIRDRITSILAEINYTRLQNGTPTEEEMVEIQGVDAGWEGHIVITSTSEATVPSIAAKIVQHRPSAVIVDGTYFMDSTENHPRNSPQALTSITRAFKRLAMRANIPILISTQVLPSRYNPAKGITLDGIGYSSSFAQDSDLVLGVDTPDVNFPEKKRIAVVAARDAPIVETMILWDWERTAWEEEYEHVRSRTVAASDRPNFLRQAADELQRQRRAG